jgi:hypothetical protein
VNLLLIATLAAVVLVPLAREYADLRTVGLPRGSALGVVSLLVPALAVGLAVTMPFAARPSVQWAAAVIVTVALYSAAARAILARASAAATAPSRRT